MASLIGAKEFAAALNLVSSKDKKQIAQGVALAASLEQQSFDFYSAQAQKAQLQELKNFFSFLAGQERMHLEAINSLKAALQENKKWTEPPINAVDTAPSFKFFSQKDWDKNNDPGTLTAVLFALWKEKQAQEFYSNIAARTKSKEIKKFFLRLVEFEKMHAQMLESYVDNSYYTNELIMG